MVYRPDGPPPLQFDGAVTADDVRQFATAEAIRALAEFTIACECRDEARMEQASKKLRQIATAIDGYRRKVVRSMQRNTQSNSQTETHTQ